MADGSRGSIHVAALQGDPEKWDRASEIAHVNPLMWTFPESRAVLLEERDKARQDSRLRARFLSYRMNVPAKDDAAVLVPVAHWQRACGRDVPDPEGRPIVGVDLGGGRAWSAAVALWRNGRSEAVAPGIPSIHEQERRDRVPSGTYQRLVDSGRLLVADGLRVQPPGMLLDLARPWRPEFIVCDRFRLPELLDRAGGHLPILPRVTRWSEASEDIRALRRMAADGPLAVVEDARELFEESLGAAEVKNDDQGGVRLAKRGTTNQARDDVAAALVLAAGAVSRLPARRGAYLGTA